jgi:hypothetical protein
MLPRLGVGAKSTLHVALKEASEKLAQGDVAATRTALDGAAEHDPRQASSATARIIKRVPRATVAIETAREEVYIKLFWRGDDPAPEFAFLVPFEDDAASAVAPFESAAGAEYLFAIFDLPDGQFSIVW